MSKGLGRSLKTILDDVENSYKEIELDKKKLSKKRDNELDNFVNLLNEKYELNVVNRDNNLIISVDSKKKLRKLKKIFNI